MDRKRILRGRHVAVVGLDRRGCELVRALVADNIEVSAWDVSEPLRAAASAEGLPLADPSQRDWADLDAVVLARISPGLKEYIDLAGLTETPLISAFAYGALRLAALEEGRCPRLICVAGVRGAGSVRQLLTGMLQRADRDLVDVTDEGLFETMSAHHGQHRLVRLSTLDMLGAELVRPYMTLVSSFGPHGDDPDGLLELLSRSRHAIIGTDTRLGQKYVTALKGRGHGEVHAASGMRALSRGVYHLGRDVYSTAGGQAERLCRRDMDMPIIGRHARLNFAVAAAGAQNLIRDPRKLKLALATVSPPRHCMEVVAQAGGISFIDDGYAQSPDATIAALEATDQVYLITAGLNDGTGLQPFPAHVSGKIIKTYVLGERASALASMLEGSVPYEIYRNLDRAVARAGFEALMRARQNTVVLFSPGCAYEPKDWDMFAKAARLVAQEIGRKVA